MSSSTGYLYLMVGCRICAAYICFESILHFQFFSPKFILFIANYIFLKISRSSYGAVVAQQIANLLVLSSTLSASFLFSFPNEFSFFLNFLTIISNKRRFVIFLSIYCNVSFNIHCFILS